MQEADSIKPEGLYGPRASENIHQFIDTLSMPPEKPLTPDQREQAIEFENELMDGMFRLPDDRYLQTDRTSESLAEVDRLYKYENSRCEITLDYLFTDEGIADLAGLGLPVDQTSDFEVMAVLLRAKAIDLPDVELKKLSIKSEQYAINKVAEAIAAGLPVDVPRRVTVFNDASKLLARASGLFAHRRFLAEARGQLKEDAIQGMDSDLIDAQQAIVRMYKRKVNGMVADIEPDLMSFWQQIQCMDQPGRQLLEEAMSMTWPMVTRINVNDDATNRFSVRLDRLKYGVAMRNGKFTAISESLDKLFEADELGKEQADEEPSFKPQEVEQLSKVIFNATQIQAFIKEFADRVGILSPIPDSEYAIGQVWPDESKIQAVIRDDVESMGFKNTEGAVAIPGSFSRSLTTANPPAGVVSITPHELKHASQHMNMRRSSTPLKFGKLIPGNKATILREAGAIDVERQVQAKLFGQRRTDNPHYAKALKVIEQGGDEIEATQASYESFMQANPGADPKQAAITAFDRVDRLTRRKGGFNSQPLDYAESALISMAMEKLEPVLKQKILSEGSLGIQDMAELHQYGLLESDPQPFPIEEYISYAEEKMRQILDA